MKNRVEKMEIPAIGRRKSIKDFLDKIKIEEEDMIYDELRSKYKDIEEYSIESGDWEDEGVEAFKEGNYKLAVESFEKVIVAIPDHFNGYEMCSYALYKGGNKEEAVAYLEKGIEVAKAFDGDAKLPEEMIDDMEKSLEAMKSGKELDKKYIEEIME